MEDTNNETTTVETKEPEFEAIKAATVKKTNPEQSITVSLWDGGKFYRNMTVTKRAPTANALTNEVQFWASKFGFVVGKEAKPVVVPAPVVEAAPAEAAKLEVVPPVDAQPKPAVTVLKKTGTRN